MPDCKKGPKECAACEKKYCLPLFYTCGGFTGNSPDIHDAMLSAVRAIPTNECINPSDISEINKDTFWQTVVSFISTFRASLFLC